MQERLPFLKKCFQQLSDKSSNVVGEIDSREAELMTAVQTLISLLATENTPPESVKSFLSNQRISGFDQETVDAFVGLYKTAQLPIPESESLFPRLTGSNWRVDYCVESNTKSELRSPLFLLDLELDGSQQVQMAMDYNTVQDLIDNLRISLNM